MKIIRTIKIESHQFYDYLEKQLLNDLQQSHRNISVNDIKKGFKYTKEDAESKLTTEIHILQYIRGECYRFKVTYMSDSTTIDYRTKNVADGLEITMTQQIRSFEEKKHNKLSRAFHEAVYLSRMSHAIYDIEKNILEMK